MRTPSKMMGDINGDDDIVTNEENSSCDGDETQVPEKVEVSEVMDPQQMLDRTKQLIQSFLTTPVIVKRNDADERESDSSESGCVNISRKRRKVDKLKSGSSDEFEESPLRKSLSPKVKTSASLSDSSCKKITTNSSPISSRGVPHKYTTRNKAAKKKISYEDPPNMTNSDSDFASTPESTSSEEEISTRQTRSTKRKKRSVHVEESSTSSRPNSSANSSSSNGEMRINKPKNKKQMRLPLFGNERQRGPSNYFAKHDTPYYRDRYINPDDHVEPDFIDKEEEEEEEEEQVAKKIALSVFQDSEDGVSTSDSVVKEKQKAQPTPPSRRSKRQTPRRHPKHFQNSLKTLQNGKDKGIKNVRKDRLNSQSQGDHPSDDSGVSSTADEDKDFTAFARDYDFDGSSTHKKRANKINFSQTDDSQEPGPSHLNSTPGLPSNRSPGPSPAPETGRSPAPENNQSPAPETGRSQAPKNSQSPGLSNSQSPGLSNSQSPRSCNGHISLPTSPEASKQKQKFRARAVTEGDLKDILSAGDYKALPDNITPQTHPTLLCDACSISTANTVDYILLKFGYDPFVKVDKRMPLSYAIDYQKPDIVTVLLTAMSARPRKVASELTKRCASKLVESDIGCLKAVTHWSDAHGHPDAMSYLEDMLDSRHGQRQIFMSIGEHVNLDALKFMVLQDIKISDYSLGYIMLESCITSEYWEREVEKCMEFFEFLLSQISPDWLSDSDEDGFNTLLKASSRGLDSVVECLIRRGIDVHVCDKEGTTALHLAAIEGHDRCVELLIRADKATLSNIDRSGWTAVMYAVYAEAWDIVDLMLGATLHRSSSTLLTTLYSLMCRRYKANELRKKNYTMIVKLIRYLAHNDQYRLQLNEFIDTCQDTIMDKKIFHELFGMPGLITLAVKWRWIRREYVKQSGLYTSMFSVAARRDHYLADLWNCIGLKQGSLMCSFKQEEAVGPGPTKEFFSIFGEELVKAKMFCTNKEGCMLFTYLLKLCDPITSSMFRKFYAMAGAMTARAIIQDRVIGFRPDPYILNYMLNGTKNVLKDFENVDKELFDNINSISDEDFAGLDIPLVLDVIHPLTSKTVELPLIQGVDPNKTATSKRGYLTLLARAKLYDLCGEELDAMREGFMSIFPDQYLTHLNVKDMAVLIAGQSNLSLSDWRTYTSYQGHVPQEVKTQFWSCVMSFTPEDRLLLLHFTTGLSGLPPGGFIHIRPPFSICHQAYNETDSLLPQAATCSNLLKLPPYSTMDNMREKLLVAIRYGAKGFSFV